MEILMVLIGCIMAFILTGGIDLLIDHSQQKSIDKRHIRELVEKVDEEGYPKNYDPHYTRDLEVKQGLRPETQCDDTNCTKCYWKIRTMRTSGHHGAYWESRRNEFIKELPDGLSDELYDSMLEDWQISVRPEIEARNAKELEEMEAYRRAQVERHYATPYNLVQRYKAEGRVFDKSNNSWSTPTEITWTKAEKKVLERNKAHWKKKFEAQHPKPQVKAELSVYHNGNWMPLGKYREELFGVPPNIVGTKDVKTWRELNADLKEQREQLDRLLNRLRAEKDYFEVEYKNRYANKGRLW